MKRLILYTSLAVVSAALYCGCGRGDSTSASDDAKAFESAPPEVKERWMQAQSAAGTNDYIQAILALRTLLPRELTPEQRVAVETAIGGYDAKLTKAAARGDAEAQKALEMLRQPDAQSGR